MALELILFDMDGTIVQYNNSGISREQTAYFGDHFNDIPAWKEVSLPLGMNLKDERGHAHIKAQFADFHQANEFLEEQHYL